MEVVAAASARRRLPFIPSDGKDGVVGGGMRVPTRGRALRWASVLLLSLLVACKGTGEPPKKAEAPAAAGGAGADAEGFETGWLGHLSRTYPGGLAETTEGAKAALRRLQIDVVDESPGMFETTLEAISSATVMPPIASTARSRAS
jgi:hypothetical protein